MTTDRNTRFGFCQIWFCSSPLLLIARTSCHRIRRLKGLSLPFPKPERGTCQHHYIRSFHFTQKYNDVRWKLLNSQLERTLAPSVYVSSLCTHTMTGMLLQEDAWPVTKVEQPLLFSTRALEFIAFST